MGTKVHLRVTWKNPGDKEPFLKWITEGNRGRISSYLITSEHEDTNHHWHCCLATTFKNQRSLRSCLLNQFKHWEGNGYYSLKAWRNDGMLRYICKGTGRGELPDVVAISMLGVNVEQMNQEFYKVGDEMKMSGGMVKEWMPDLLNKIRKNGLDYTKDADRFKIFEELTSVCPGVTEQQLVQYMLKIRRALDKAEYDQGMWVKLCDKIY